MKHRRSIAGFILLASAAVSSIVWLDHDVAQAFGAMKQQYPTAIAPFQALTTLGKSQWYLYPLGVALLLTLGMARWRPSQRPLWQQRAKVIGFLFANIALSGLLVDLLKIIIGRPRPILLLEQGIFNQFDPFRIASRWWSFPSGHSATAASLALALGSLWPRARWLLLLLAGSIAASRVIVTAHYVGDILGGIGIAVLVYIWLERFYQQRGWVVSPPAAVKEKSLAD